MIPLHLLTGALFGWLEHEQRDAIQFPRAENRVLRAQLHGRRMRLRDDDRRRLCGRSADALAAGCSPTWQPS